MKNNISETGVYLGRFSPLHKGHQSVLETLISDFGKKTLIQIGSSNRLEERTPFTFLQRKKIIQTLYPEVEIMPLPDIAQSEHDQHQTAEPWLDQISEEEERRKTKFIFYGGSEQDLSFLSQRFETNLVCRNILPISGTEIRNALKNKDFEVLKDLVDEKVIDLISEYFMFQSAQVLEDKKLEINKKQKIFLNASHIISQKEKAEIYPERIKIPENKIFWETDFPEYEPPNFTAKVVLDPNTPWADSEIFSKKNMRKSFEGNISFDPKSGFPLNPQGRTGISGRGILGKFGPNLAVDPVITRENPETGVLEILLIKRGDDGSWAFPGGFLDEKEKIETALSRELKEETGISLNMNNSEILYEGYVDSSRNTDNAWVETVAKHKHLELELADILPTAGDDAVDAKWFDISDLEKLEMPLTHQKIINLLKYK